MRKFKQIIKDCIKNKNNGQFEIYFEEFIKCDELVDLLSKYRKKEYIVSCIELLLKEHSFNPYPPELKTFKNALTNKIKEIKGNKRIDYRIKKNQIESKMKSLDSSQYEDSSASLKDEIADDSRSVEKIAEDNETNEFIKELLEIGLKENTWQFAFMLKLYDLSEYNSFENLSDCVSVLNVNEKFHSKVKSLLMFCGKRNEKVRKMISSLFSFSIYEKFIEYLIETNNKKLKISELIIDFNKLRNYLSVLFYNNDIKNKSSFIQQCDFGSVSSYEKEIHRILSLFKTDKTIFELKDELKGYSPNEFSKIFNIHTVPNLVSNFLILNVIQQYKQETDNKEIKLSKIVDILFPNNSKNIKERDKTNFRKYNLLPRLKEMNEYGFISIDEAHKDRYILNARFLNDKHKDVLKYVVPFFCGIYPFSSIGHFLANRLDIKDIFKFETYNICNILDDCITYDLLQSINSNKEISLELKDNSTKTIIPKMLFIEDKTKLLKVLDNKNEYYLHKISDIKYNKKPNNPIFSEIYSFYYKIFEELVKEYKKDKNFDKTKVNKVLEKYGTKDTALIFEKIDKNVLSMLAKLDNIEIPLTNLELRWLKTIMQDTRFDLFVSEDEKHSLENLVKDVTPFELSAFKIYDNKTKTYKSITTVEIPKGEDRDSLKKKLKAFNSVLYSIQNNTFDFN